MQKLLTLFLSFFVFSAFTANALTSQSKINWITNYQEAVNQSKATSKPMVLFFTGSDWCSWCHKLESEALSTDEFAQIAGDKFIFVLLDFPSSKAYPEKNDDLKSQYGIQGFPTLVIVDSNGNKIGSTGYQPGGGRAYAEHLLNLAQKHRSSQ